MIYKEQPKGCSFFIDRVTEHLYNTTHEEDKLY